VARLWSAPGRPARPRRDDDVADDRRALESATVRALPVERVAFEDREQLRLGHDAVPHDPRAHIAQTIAPNG